MTKEHIFIFLIDVPVSQNFEKKTVFVIGYYDGLTYTSELLEFFFRFRSKSRCGDKFVFKILSPASKQFRRADH